MANTFVFPTDISGLAVEELKLFFLKFVKLTPISRETGAIAKDRNGKRI